MSLTTHINVILLALWVSWAVYWFVKSAGVKKDTNKKDWQRGALGRLFSEQYAEYKKRTKVLIPYVL